MDDWNGCWMSVPWCSSCSWNFSTKMTVSWESAVICSSESSFWALCQQVQSIHRVFPPLSTAEARRPLTRLVWGLCGCLGLWNYGVLGEITLSSNGHKLLDWAVTDASLLWRLERDDDNPCWHHLGSRTRWRHNSWRRWRFCLLRVASGNNITLNNKCTWNKIVCLLHARNFPSTSIKRRARDSCKNKWWYFLQPTHSDCMMVDHAIS